MEIFIAIITSIISGGLLTFLVFVIRDRLLGVPDLSGTWTYTCRVEKTSHDPFQGMEVKYIALIWLEGTAVHGTAEKVFERSSKGELKYVGEKRNRLTIEGYITNKYVYKDSVVLHIVENGRIRDTHM